MYCPSCLSENIHKNGRSKARSKNIQRYRCGDCKKYFTSESYLIKIRNSYPNCSQRFVTLVKELQDLRVYLLPSQFSPTSDYSKKQNVSTLSYRIMAHAEIEAYIEDRANEAVGSALKSWKNEGKVGITILSLICFCGKKLDIPPESLIPKKARAAWDQHQIELDGKIGVAYDSFRQVVHGNHGIKEKNILSLLMPVGLKYSDFDATWIANMNTFGEQRGFIAHSSSSNKALQLPDPKLELERVALILHDLYNIDILINQLS